MCFVEKSGDSRMSSQKVVSIFDFVSNFALDCLKLNLLVFLSGFRGKIEFKAAMKTALVCLYYKSCLRHFVLIQSYITV